MNFSQVLFFNLFFVELQWVTRKQSEANIQSHALPQLQMMSVLQERFE